MKRAKGYKYGPAFGTDALRLKGKYITPLFWKTYEFISACLGAVFLFWLLYMWSVSNWSGEWALFVICFVVVIAIVYALKIPPWAARSMFGTRIDVVIGAGWVKVGGLLTYKTYHTNNFGFAVEPHEKTEQEAVLEQQNPAKAKKKPGLYRHTKQLVMYIEDKRVVLASIYFAPLVANAMVTRLNLMKQAVINQQMTG